MTCNKLYFIFLCLIANFSHAQKEASVWSIGSGKEINFQSGSILYSNFTGNQKENSTICDKDGNLVLYSNGRVIWNKNNDIILGGEQMIDDKAIVKNPPVFLPYPGKPNWYIMIYDEDFLTTNKGEYQNTIYFAEIDASANGGKGAVTLKNQKIHDNYHLGVTISGYCDNSYYWLTIEKNENVTKGIYVDRIYNYKIDENGLNPVHLINQSLDIGNSINCRFSPDGDKIFYSYEENVTNNKRYLIADFNFNTGVLYNFRNIGFNASSSVEFSPNSELLYFFSGNQLIQVDTRYSNETLIKNSADAIISINSDANSHNLDLQLAPDGKLYFTYSGTDKKMHLGVINKPNQRGASCEVENDIFTADIIRLPDFVTSFFKEKNLDKVNEVFVNLNDMEVCSNSSIKITQDNPAAYYTWIPELDIVDPFSNISVYNPKSKKDIISRQPTTYTIRATDKNCWVDFDTIVITALPVPKILPVDGSWSVCPYVEDVEYSTVPDGNTLQWFVDGGSIHSGQSSDKVKINWEDTNPNASVNLYSVNNYSCHSDTAVFPVRINEILITETPKGLEQLCMADSKNVEYQIKNTNGSIYSWRARDGQIISGQGTNKVIVDWLNDGLHELVVEESSTTKVTVCYGASDPLEVKVIDDALDINLDQVSFDLDNTLNINYSSTKLQDKHSLFLVVQGEGSPASEASIITKTPDNKYLYTPDELSPEIITLKVVNTCNETIYSNQQETIILTGEFSEVSANIHLAWNNNRFWNNDDIKQEIWYSENGLNDWKLLADNVISNEYNFIVDGQASTYYFRIKINNHDKIIESWSNKIEVIVQDEMSFPDVFTPNDDGVNDYWVISNAKFHSVKSVIVYDRLGQVVYQCNNEYIPWNGRINGTVIQGTYFYQITYDKSSVKYGYVTVLK